MSNAPSYNVYKDQGKFEHCKLLMELSRLIAMNCGQKLFNPPSCAARLQQMTMTCGRITNYTICVARDPLWRTIWLNSICHDDFETSYTIAKLHYHKIKRFQRKRIVFWYLNFVNLSNLNWKKFSPSWMLICTWNMWLLLVRLQRVLNRYDYGQLLVAELNVGDILFQKY